MYVRKVDDRVLTFRVSGKLWNRSLVMSDVETDTEWAHLLGRAMSGELKGATLEALLTDMVTWGQWREQYPDTTVLDMSRKRKEYTREFYREPSRFVFGFQVSGEAWALPMEEMISRPVHSFKIGDLSLLATFGKRGGVTHLFEATVDGKDLEFSKVDDATMKDAQTGSLWKIISGEAVSGEMKGTFLEQRVGIMSFRKAWQAFYPETRDVAF